MHCLACSLQRRVDSRHAQFEDFCSFGGGMSECLTQNEDASLLRRQSLEQGRDREPQSVRSRCSALRLSITPPVRGGRHQPRNIQSWDKRGIKVDARSTEIVRQGPTRRCSQPVYTDVAGDAVGPSCERCYRRIERLSSSPSPLHRFLHDIISIEGRAEHLVGKRKQPTTHCLKFVSCHGHRRRVHSAFSAIQGTAPTVLRGARKRQAEGPCEWT